MRWRDSKKVIVCRELVRRRAGVDRTAIRPRRRRLHRRRGHCGAYNCDDWNLMSRTLPVGGSWCWGLGVGAFRSGGLEVAMGAQGEGEEGRGYGFDDRGGGRSIGVRSGGGAYVGVQFGQQVLGKSVRRGGEGEGVGCQTTEQEFKYRHFV